MFCGLGLLASAAVSAQAQEVPELEFLEFLGEWSESDQAWLDSQQPADADTDQTQTEVNEHE